MTDIYVYKLLAAPDWEVAHARGVTATVLDEGDGFVHLSSKAQVAETARLHYKDKMDVELLRFRVTDLPPLKWEESRGGQFFPHLYGALEVAKADARWTLLLDADGVPILPEGF